MYWSGYIPLVAWVRPANIFWRREFEFLNALVRLPIFVVLSDEFEACQRIRSTEDPEYQEVQKDEFAWEGTDGAGIP
jgi:hypothetical protein